jgi:hypothetical protein
LIDLHPHDACSARQTKDTGESIAITDALDIQNAAFMIPRAMTQIVQEGIEPLLIGEKLLQKIQYKPGMTTVFPPSEPLGGRGRDGRDVPRVHHQHWRRDQLRRAGSPARYSTEDLVSSYGAQFCHLRNPRPRIPAFAL